MALFSRSCHSPPNSITLLPIPPVLITTMMLLLVGVVHGAPLQGEHVGTAGAAEEQKRSEETVVISTYNLPPLMRKNHPQSNASFALVLVDPEPTSNGFTYDNNVTIVSHTNSQGEWDMTYAKGNDPEKVSAWYYYVYPNLSVDRSGMIVVCDSFSNVGGQVVCNGLRGSFPLNTSYTPPDFGSAKPAYLNLTATNGCITLDQSECNLQCSSDKPVDYCSSDATFPAPWTNASWVGGHTDKANIIFQTPITSNAPGAAFQLPHGSGAGGVPLLTLAAGLWQMMRGFGGSGGKKHVVPKKAGSPQQEHQENHHHNR